MLIIDKRNVIILIERVKLSYKYLKLKLRYNINQLDIILLFFQLLTLADCHVSFLKNFIFSIEIFDNNPRIIQVNVQQV